MKKTELSHIGKMMLASSMRNSIREFVKGEHIIINILEPQEGAYCIGDKIPIETKVENSELENYLNLIRNLRLNCTIINADKSNSDTRDSIYRYLYKPHQLLQSFVPIVSTTLKIDTRLKEGPAKVELQIIYAYQQTKQLPIGNKVEIPIQLKKKS